LTAKKPPKNNLSISKNHKTNKYNLTLTFKGKTPKLTDPTKYQEIGLFSSSIKPKPKNFIPTSTDPIYPLTTFEIFDINARYLSRKWNNSLRSFLDTIPEHKTYFTKENLEK
jgi:hypothetical protein